MGILGRAGSHSSHLRSAEGHYASLVKEHVATGAALFTDEMGGYKGLSEQYEHQIIDHAVKYVDGRVHTNCLENFWSLLKRGLSDTYVSVEPFHLFRYLDEQVFRFNNVNFTPRASI